AFHEFVVARAGDVRDPEMSGRSVERVRRQVRADVGSAIELEQAVDDFGSTYGVLARPGTSLRRRWRGSPAVVAAAAARATHVALEELCGRGRRRSFVQARRLALLTWTSCLDCPIAEMAAVLGLSASAASQLLANDSRAVQMRAQAEALAARIRARGRP